MKFSAVLNPCRRSAQRGWWLIAAAWPLGALAGTNTVETDVGAEAVATSNDTPLLDCGTFSYDKRGLLGVRDTYAERDATYSGALLGRARLTDQKNLKPYEANGSVSGEWREARHAVRLGYILDYANSEQWGCSTSIASRLQRQRDLRNKILVPGDSVHTQTGTAAYAYTMPGDIFTLSYSNQARRGQLDDYNSTLDASIDHSVQKNLQLQATVGGGRHTGNFDPAAFTHTGGAVLYRPDRVLGLSLAEDAELRNTGEKRFATTAAINLATSRILTEQLGLVVHQFVHSPLDSDALASAEVDLSLRRWKYTLAAHRLQINDSRHSSSNWFNAAIAHSLTRQQTLTATASYGSEQPQQMKMMTSAGLNYAALFGTPNTRKGHDTPRYALTAGYLVTRLVGLNNLTNTVRQVQAGVLATF